MAEKKETKTTSTVDPEIRGLNIYGKLAVARGKFLEAPVKKSGINRHAEYKYFELEDIVPVATAIFNNLGLVFLVSFENGSALGRLVNIDKPEEIIVFESPMIELTVTDRNTGETKSPAGMNSVQALGGSETYQRRYLYMMCLDIVEADAFDATQGKPDPETGKSEAPKKSNKPASVAERQEAKKELIDEGGKMTDTQSKSILNGLKKLRDKDFDKYEAYVQEMNTKRKSGTMTKKEAEDALIEIGNKIAE